MSDFFQQAQFWLRPFSPVYGSLMAARSFLYRNGIWKREKMAVPVISVGNLTMGGTGKTPVVQYIAGLLAEKGCKPAIISRGYGGKAKGRINIVSNGKTVFLNAREAGDEPRFLAETLPGIPVLTGKVRIYPCRYAIEQLGCDVLILDDGFQHLSIVRDIDLVLFNALTLAGNKRVFPGGPLREPFSALSRADAFLLTGALRESSDALRQFNGLLRRSAPDRPVFFSTYQASSCRKLHETATVPLGTMPTPLYGFCGIAEPERFRKSLEDCGIKLTGFSALRDHQQYSSELLEKIACSALESGAAALITTEKDSVKIQALSCKIPLYSLAMDVGMEPSFAEFLLQRLMAARSACAASHQMHG
jgi:tetraacyldisaccharide 4'-kinase